MPLWGLTCQCYDWRMSAISQVYSLEGRDAVRRILQSALDAAQPAELVRRSMRREGQRLVVAGNEYDLSVFEKIHLLSVGKAAPGLAQALDELLGDFLARGLVIAKVGSESG